VLVLDTGFAGETFRPAGMDWTGVIDDGSVTNLKPAGPFDEPDEDADAFIDPVAGHGTFIAGLIHEQAPDADIHVCRVLSTFGVGDDFTIAKLIKRFTDGAVQVGDVAGWRPDILNCSFGAPTPDDEPPQAMTAEIAALQELGCVVVASAGNDASCRPSWPAALPDVISVAALGPEGPAPFTNFGPWVRASAPGVDVVSRFFHFEGDESTATDLEKAIGDYGAGYATWSGTSFSAPIVAGVLAAAVARDDISPKDAVRRYLDDPTILRLPGLGTIVNVVPWRGPSA
jgi:subtilisin family serine protease